MRLVMAALLVTSLASAADYYVTPSGSDSDPGTRNAPWKTLQHAVSAIAAGDTVLVESGTYAGFRIEASGAEERPKTIQAAPNASVLINAPGPKNRHRSAIEIESFDGAVTDWVIDGFEVSGAPVYGIDLRGTDRITLRNNKVFGSGRTGIFTGFANHVVIEKNEAYENGEHGIYQSNSSKYSVIRGNRSHHNAGSGIHMNGDLEQGPPGLIEFAAVEENVVFENGAKGGSGINCDGVDNSVIRGNVLTNNHANGISLYGIAAAHSSSNNQVLNNRIVMAPHSQWALNIPDDGAVAPPAGNVAERNVLCTPDNNKGSILIAKGQVKGFVSNDNVVVNRFSADNGNSIVSLAQWQKLGYDKQSTLNCDTALSAR